MKVTANIKYLKISAQKLRLAADAIRSQNVTSAQEVLAGMPQKSARMIRDGLNSALANAVNNYNLNASTLNIAEIKVDQGPSLKRGRPRARGSYGRIVHPTAHLRVVLEDTTSGTESQPVKNEIQNENKSKPKVTTKITSSKRRVK